MKPGQHSIVDTIPEYGFSAECEMPTPAGVTTDSPLETELELLHFVSATQVPP